MSYTSKYTREERRIVHRIHLMNTRIRFYERRLEKYEKELADGGDGSVLFGLIKYNKKQLKKFRTIKTRLYNKVKHKYGTGQLKLTGTKVGRLKKNEYGNVDST